MFLTIGQSTLFIIVCFLSFVGSFWNIRIALADSRSERDSIAERLSATALVPLDSKNWQRLARLQHQRGLPSLAAYTRATDMNPLEVSAWIDMGLEREVNQDLQPAEATLLHAAAISREYVPRWTLLNFYFRRNDAVHFWPWARRALDIAYGDVTPIFRMAWALTADSGQVQREMLPDRPPVLAQYLVWLTSAGKLEDASRIFARLISQAGQEQATALEYYCNTQLSLGNVVAAKAAWAGMVGRHLVPADDAPGDTLLTNGRFTHDILNTGFDWRKVAIDGVVIRPNFPGLRINLSGKQPETCELISQYVPLEAGRTYELVYEYQTSGFAPPSGISWRVLDAKSGTELTKSPTNLAREKMGWESLTFITPRDLQGVRLLLYYQRALGTTRINGWLQLKQVALRIAN